MKYFATLPQIQYQFTTGQFTIPNLFVRVGFKPNFYENPSLFSETVNETAASPDKLSFERYTDPSYYWMLLLLNNIYDVNTDWSIIQENLDNILTRLSKQSVYYLYEGADIIENDILYLSESSYGVVQSWNPFYKELVLKENFNIPADSLSDLVFKIRRINTDNTVTELNNYCGTGSTDFHAFGYSRYINSPTQIIGPNNVILNPFTQIGGGGGTTITDGLLIDTCDESDRTAFQSSLIYRVINNLQVDGISIQRKQQQVLSEFVDKRDIKLLSASVLSVIEGKVRQMVNDPVVKANTLFRTG
jgi:hypothetical protein